MSIGITGKTTRETTWAPNRTGNTQTINSTQSVAIPYGKKKVKIGGKGQDGTAAVPGNANIAYDFYGFSYQNPAYYFYTPQTSPGYPYSFFGGQVINWDPANGNIYYAFGYNYDTYIPSYTFYSDTNVPGNSGFYSAPGNNYVSGFNASTPGTTGASVSVLGVTLPGGVNTAASVVPGQYISAGTLPSQQTQLSVTVPSGQYVTISFE